METADLLLALVSIFAAVAFFVRNASIKSDARGRADRVDALFADGETAVCEGMVIDLATDDVEYGKHQDCHYYFVYRFTVGSLGEARSFLGRHYVGDSDHFGPGVFTKLGSSVQVRYLVADPTVSKLEGLEYFLDPIGSSHRSS